MQIYADIGKPLPGRWQQQTPQHLQWSPGIVVSSLKSAQYVYSTGPLPSPLQYSK